MLEWETILSWIINYWFITAVIQFTFKFFDVSIGQSYGFPAKLWIDPFLSLKAESHSCFHRVDCAAVCQIQRKWLLNCCLLLRKSWVVVCCLDNLKLFLVLSRLIYHTTFDVVRMCNYARLIFPYKFSEACPGILKLQKRARTT